MRMEQTFEVQAPLAQVWAALNDLERVAPCLPGATITGHDDDGTYRGTFTVKLGPMTAAYNGTIKIEDVDEAAHRATLKARGTDKRGQGGANATIVNTLSEHDGGTRVEAVTDFTITGRLAQFGRGGMMEDVSNRLLRDFASCLATRLAETPEPVAEVPSGAEVAAGDAAPEAVAAAATTPPSTPPPSGPPPTPPPQAEPLKGGSLFFAVLWERIKRLFTRR
jgi:carbon monoxide dehydrogenase subunit G